MLDRLAKILELSPHLDVLSGDPKDYKCAAAWLIDNGLFEDFASKIFNDIDRIVDKHYDYFIFGPEDLSDTEREAVMNFNACVSYDYYLLVDKYAPKKVEE